MLMDGFFSKKLYAAISVPLKLGPVKYYSNNPGKRGTIEFFDIIEISPFEEINEWCLIHKRNAWNLKNLIS